MKKNTPESSVSVSPNPGPRNRRVFRIEDVTEEIIEAIKNAKVDPRHDYLDDELLKDWVP